MEATCGATPMAGMGSGWGERAGWRDAESEPLKFFTGPVYDYNSNAKVSATVGSLCNPATCTLIHLLLLANELPQLEHANKRNVMVNAFVD